MALTEVDAARLNDNVFNATGPYTNRIINGDMRIDQRNAGASVAVSNGTLTYGADRFLVYEDTSASGCTVQQVTDAPANFSNSFKFTVGTGGSATAAQAAVIEHRIEGYNFADFAFGTASAKTFTLSFLVKATAAGTYCVAFRNASDNRSFVTTYSISSANTWEQKTVIVPGDASGTWNTTNGIGIHVRFDLGSGSNYQTNTLNAWQAGLFFTNSAQVNLIGTSSSSLQITGVQLEAGSVATPFERRSYGQELSLCQRYFSLNCTASAGNITVTVGQATSSSTAASGFRPAVQMRATPTLTVPAGATFGFSNSTYSAGAGGTVSLGGESSKDHIQFSLSGGSGLTAGNATGLVCSYHGFFLSAEL